MSLSPVRATVFFVFAKCQYVGIIRRMVREHASIAALPDTPGVYFFIGARREVLYVGKATSLCDRVRSYFATDLASTRGPHMVRMVEEAKRVDFRATDSVLEALILEAKCIKELKPRYNTRDKDDKSWNYVVLTTHEPLPRVLLVRGKELDAKLRAFSSAAGGKADVPYYGPFVHAAQLKEALKLIRKIFPFYDTTQPVLTLRARGDRKLRFNESIGVYPPEGTTEKEYAKTIKHIRLLFEGKKGHLLRSLERDMHAYARKEAFEDARRCRRQIEALRHINDVSLLRRDAESGSEGRSVVRVEAYDVAHLQGGNMTGVMTVVMGGEPCTSEYRTFTVRTVAKSNDTAALREVLVRRFGHPEWEYPRLLVVDGGTAQLNVARSVLHELGMKIPVVAVTKDDHHRPKALIGSHPWRITHAREALLANAEAHRFSLAKHRSMRKRAMLAG